MTRIADNIQSVLARMDDALASCSRAPGEVRLVAVSKHMDISRIGEAIDAGLRIFGENHAQEFVQKQTFFEQNQCSVHFIGQLQTNKVKCICGTVALIESVDRAHLAQALQTRAQALEAAQDVLIQVNIGNEPQKGGVADGDVDSFAEMLADQKNLRVRGLMCVPPVGEAEAARGYFRRMKALFDRMAGAYPQGVFDTLSMGMSHDFEVAIQEGATEIRVGTGIFGARERK